MTGHQWLFVAIVVGASLLIGLGLLMAKDKDDE